MRYMIVERFRNGDPGPVYERFRRCGRLAPDGLRYIDSWVSEDLTCCYQLMECDEPSLLAAWMAAWEDIVSFEIVPVVSSVEAATDLNDGLSRARRVSA